MGTVIFLRKKTCIIPECGKPSLTRGYCRAHYKKLRASGDLVMRTGELAERGRKEDHPLYCRWRQMKSLRHLSPEWARFWDFVDSVGESRGRTKMLRLDQSKPFGPDNFRWAEKLVGERKNAYYRNWYKNSPNQRDALYRKQYGIGLAEYNALSEAQDGLCAICRRAEERIVRKGVNHDKRRLAVDHDHATGEVRGLLCSDCNRAVGMLRDDPALFDQGGAYLRAHQRNRLKVVE